MSDVITIRGLRVDCVVGVYPHERHQMQPLEVDIAMTVDTREAAAEGRLRRTVDYAATANQVAFLLQSCQFHLLETAARAIVRLLLAPPAPSEERPPIEAVTVRLEKPYALAGKGVPSLSVTRSAADVKLLHEDKPWGTVDVIDETREVGIYRLNVAPGAGIPVHLHRRMRETELVMGEGLHCQGKAVAAGSVFRWPKDAPHRYDNPSDRWQSILCVDAPPFDPSDEVEVDAPLADVRPEPPFIPTGTAR